ncbi:hypothetical protein GC197_07365 [bacterium]|nr:hypothetical protein [bacterium]
MAWDSKPTGWLRLALVVLVVAGIWGLLLPRLAQTKWVREREALLKEHRIDPAAMFYTELEFLDDKAK